MADEHAAAKPQEHEGTHLQHAEAWREIMLWKRKKLRAFILLGATSLWIAMEFFDYTFITLFSDVSIAAVVIIFIWGIITRLLQREEQDLWWLTYVRKEKADETADFLRRRIQDGIQTIFRFATEGKWFTVAGVLAGLYLLSIIAGRIDFPTICFIGVVGGLTIPVIGSVEEVRKWGEWVRCKFEEFVSMADEKLQMMKVKMKSLGRRMGAMKNKKME